MEIFDTSYARAADILQPCKSKLCHPRPTHTILHAPPSIPIIPPTMPVYPLLAVCQCPFVCPSTLIYSLLHNSTKYRGQFFDPKNDHSGCVDDESSVHGRGEAGGRQRGKGTGRRRAEGEGEGAAATPRN